MNYRAFCTCVIPKAKQFRMTIYLNNQPLEIPDNSTLYHLVFARFGDKNTGFAAAVNEQVVSRTEYKDYRLQPNDEVLIIKATQGG